MCQRNCSSCFLWNYKWETCQTLGFRCHLCCILEGAHQEHPVGQRQTHRTNLFLWNDRKWTWVPAHIKSAFGVKSLGQLSAKCQNLTDWWNVGSQQLTWLKRTPVWTKQFAAEFTLEWKGCFSCGWIHWIKTSDTHHREGWPTPQWWSQNSTWPSSSPVSVSAICTRTRTSDTGTSGWNRTSVNIHASGVNPVSCEVRKSCNKGTTLRFGSVFPRHHDSEEPFPKPTLPNFTPRQDIDQEARPR